MGWKRAYLGMRNGMLTKAQDGGYEVWIDWGENR